MNIAQVLHDQAERRGTQRAIVDTRSSLTFAELNDRVAHAAADLAAAGLRPDDRALVFCPMSVRLYVTLIGLFRLGVTAVFLDPSAGRGHIAAGCERVSPRAFVAVPKAHLLRIVSPSIRRVPIKVFIRTSRRPGHPARARIEPRHPDSPALITFTSGSTGQPKAAVRSHGFLLAQHRALHDELDLQAGEVDLTTLPIFVLANLASGVTSVLPAADLRAPGAIDPEPLARQIRATAPTRTAASPALLDRLARHLTQSRESLALEKIFTGGAPVFPALLDRLAAVAPRASIAAVYGSTEAEPIARLNRADLADVDRQAVRSGAGLLAGRPVSSIDVRIIADRCGTPLGPYTAEQFSAESLPARAPGEIVVSGAHVLRGYLDGIGDDETKIRVGDRVWHRTGDAGYFDADGRLWLLGRCSARVSDGRGTRYPFAVECAASDVDGVRRTAFVLHRDRRLLVVELESVADEGARAALRARLQWAQLDDVLVVKQIPVDTRHNAKVDYPALRNTLDRTWRN